MWGFSVSFSFHIGVHGKGGGGNRNGGGWGGGGKKKYEFQKQIFGFSDFQFPISIFLGNIFEKHMLVGYRRINNKGVLERPGTKWKVLRAISSTLKFQYVRKVDFLMPCKTKSRDFFCLCVRTVRAITLDTPWPPQFHLKYWKNKFLWKTRFYSFLWFFVPIGPVFCPYRTL